MGSNIGTSRGKRQPGISRATGFKHLAVSSDETSRRHSSIRADAARGSSLRSIPIHPRAAVAPYHPAMIMTRTELVARIETLEAGLEKRIEDNPDTADPWPEFSIEADAIQDAAGAQDEEYVLNRITCIQAKHGLIPADDADTQSPCH